MSEPIKLRVGGHALMEIRRSLNTVLNFKGLVQLEKNVRDRLAYDEETAAAFRDGWVVSGDVGLLVVPSYVLMKPGRLDPNDLDVVRGHTTTGSQVLVELAAGNAAGMMRK